MKYMGVFRPAFPIFAGTAAAAGGCPNRSSWMTSNKAWEGEQERGRSLSWARNVLQRWWVVSTRTDPYSL